MPPQLVTCWPVVRLADSPIAPPPLQAYVRGHLTQAIFVLDFLRANKSHATERPILEDLDAMYSRLHRQASGLGTDRPIVRLCCTVLTPPTPLVL